MQSLLPFPLPSWDGLHPLVIHFPIGLLLIAPVFLVLAMIQPRRWLAFGLSGLILMLLGTGFAYVAVSTGHAAAELADKTEASAPVIEQHEDSGEDVRLIFSILTPLYALIILTPLYFMKRLGRKPLTAIHAVFLVCYLAGCVVVARTGHLGGRLVHEFGIHAIMESSPLSVTHPGPGEADGETTTTTPAAKGAEVDKD